MSWCSEWVRDWLKRNHKSQLALSQMCGIAPGNVSRWLSGRARPDRDVVATLCSALPQEEATELLIAWTRDLLPDGSEAYITVRAAPQSQSPTLNETYKPSGNRMLPDGMSEELRERLLFFGHLAVENPDIRKIIDVCYEAAKRSTGGGNQSAGR